MKTENGKIENDVEITSELTMYGMFTGNVVVKDGGTLILQGMALKTITIEEGAIVYIAGTVNGDVINKGGKVSISGTVSGKVLKQAGETNILANASIN